MTRLAFTTAVCLSLAAGTLNAAPPAVNTTAGGVRPAARPARIVPAPAPDAHALTFVTTVHVTTPDAGVYVIRPAVIRPAAWLAQTTPTTEPVADEPAADEPAATATVADFSTPKSAARAYARAIVDGDADAAKAAIVPNDQHTPVVEALAKLTVAQKHFGDAAVRAFGDAGRQLARNEQDDPVKGVDAAEVVETGDTAVLRSPGTDNVTALRKLDGQWKVDLAAMPEATKFARSLAMLDTMADIMESMTAEIDAGKYKSADEVKQAFGLRLVAGVTPPPAATTESAPDGPTTQPTTAPTTIAPPTIAPTTTAPTTAPDAAS